RLFPGFFAVHSELLQDRNVGDRVQKRIFGTACIYVPVRRPTRDDEHVVRAPLHGFAIDDGGTTTLDTAVGLAAGNPMSLRSFVRPQHLYVETHGSGDRSPIDRVD